MKKQYLSILNCIWVCTFVLTIVFTMSIESVSASEMQTEEIIVTGKSFYNMRKELRAAEARMADIFNNMIEDEEFKIVCKKNRRAGSHIGRWGCEPNFVIQARVNDFQAGQQAFGVGRAMEFVRTNRQLNYSFSEKRIEMETMIVDKAMENPELYEAIIETRNLKEEYDLARQLRFGDD